MSVNSTTWPTFLPMERMVLREGLRNPMNTGTMLACSHLIANTFEYDSARVFNRLPQKCRDELNYKTFCSETKKYLLDQGLAKSLV